MDDQWPGLSETQWDSIKGLLPRYKRPFRKAKRRGGRPRASDKAAFEAILWTLRNRARFLERLPERFGSRRTAFRRLDRWLRDGTLERLWDSLLNGIRGDELEPWTRALPACRRDTLWQEMLWVRLRLCLPPQSPAQVP